MADFINVTVKTSAKDSGKTEKDLKRVKKAVDDVAKADEKLGRQIGKTGKTTKASFTARRNATEGFRQSIRKLNTQGKQLGVNTSQLNSQFGRFASQMRSTKLTSEQLATAQRRMRAAIKETAVVMGEAKGKLVRMEKGLVRVKSATASANKPTSKFVTNMDSLARSVRIVEGPLGGTAARLQTMVAILKTVNVRAIVLVGTFTLLAVATAKVVKATISTAIALAPVRSRLAFVEGTAEKSARTFKFLQRTADELGLEFVSLATEFSQLAAATQGSALEGQKTRDVFLGVARAASALQISADDTSGVIRAFTQIVSKGTVQSEELKGQIGERLVGAFNRAADSMKLTTIELAKMLKEGKVIANDFLPKFSAELSRVFGKQALEDNLVKSINRLSNAFTSFFIILDEGFKISSVAKGVIDFTAGTVALLGAIIVNLKGIGTEAERTNALLKATETLRESLGLGVRRVSRIVPDKPEFAKVAPTGPPLPKPVTVGFGPGVLSEDFVPSKVIQALPPGETAIDAERRENAKKRFDENVQFVKQLEESAKPALQKHNEELVRLDQLIEAYPAKAKLFQTEQARITGEYLKAIPVVGMLSDSFTDLGNGMVDSLAAGNTAMESFKSGMVDLVKSVLAGFAKLALVNPIMNALFGGTAPTLFAGPGGAAAGSPASGASSGLASMFSSVLGFKNGGSFDVGGSGGTDSQPVAFRASPNERVTIETPEQQKRGKGGMEVFIDARGADQTAVNRLEAVVKSLNATFERRAVAAVEKRSRRNPNLLGSRV